MQEELQQEIENSIVSIVHSYSECFLVSIQISGKKITVIIDSFSGISIDTCTHINKDIRRQLRDDIVELYEVEVSSPGVNKPFQVIQQYIKHIGAKVQVNLYTGEGIKGILKEVNEDTIILSEQMDKASWYKEQTYTFQEIKETKLLLDF